MNSDRSLEKGRTLDGRLGGLATMSANHGDFA